MNSLLDGAESDRNNADATTEESPLAFLAHGFSESPQATPPTVNDVLAMAAELASSLHKRRA